MEKQKEIERLKALTYTDIYYEMEALKNTITELNQALQLKQGGVSGSFIEDSEKLLDDVIKYFPKFFDDFTNFEYGTGRDAGKDFKKIFNKAKRLKTKIGENYC